VITSAVIAIRQADVWLLSLILLSCHEDVSMAGLESTGIHHLAEAIAAHNSRIHQGNVKVFVHVIVDKKLSLAKPQRH